MAGKWKFTEKRQIWLAKYFECGFNGTEAARHAYPDSRNPSKMAAKMLSDPFMQKKVEEKLDELLGPLEKDFLENVKYWISTRDDESKRDSDRLKASEYLAKYRAMFVDKSELNANVSVTIQDDI